MGFVHNIRPLVDDSLVQKQDDHGRGAKGQQEPPHGHKRVDHRHCENTTDWLPMFWELSYYTPIKIADPSEVEFADPEKLQFLWVH